MLPAISVESLDTILKTAILLNAENVENQDTMPVIVLISSAATVENLDISNATALTLSARNVENQDTMLVIVRILNARTVVNLDTFQRTVRMWSALVALAKVTKGRIANCAPIASESMIIHPKNAIVAIYVERKDTEQRIIHLHTLASLNTIQLFLVEVPIGKLAM